MFDIALSWPCKAQRCLYRYRNYQKWGSTESFSKLTSCKRQFFPNCPDSILHMLTVVYHCITLVRFVKTAKQDGGSQTSRARSHTMVCWQWQLNVKCWNNHKWQFWQEVFVSYPTLWFILTHDENGKFVLLIISPSRRGFLNM